MLVQIKAVQNSIGMKRIKAISYNSTLIKTHPSFSKSIVKCGGGDAVIDLTFGQSKLLYGVD